jgi:hypothetical protein
VDTSLGSGPRNFTRALHKKRILLEGRRIGCGATEIEAFAREIADLPEY